MCISLCAHNTHAPTLTHARARTHVSLDFKYVCTRGNTLMGDAPPAPPFSTWQRTKHTLDQRRCWRARAFSLVGSHLALQPPFIYVDNNPCFPSVDLMTSSSSRLQQAIYNVALPSSLIWVRTEYLTTSLLWNIKRENTDGVVVHHTCTDPPLPPPSLQRPLSAAAHYAVQCMLTCVRSATP